MTIIEIREFMGWCLILNICFLFIMYIFLHFFPDLVYGKYKKIYMGTKEDFNKTIVKIFIQFRMLTFFFNFVPWATLHILY